MRLIVHAFGVCFLMGLPAGCDTPSAKTSSTGPAKEATAEEAAFHPVKLESERLPNLVKLHPRVISGGLPEDDAAFEELREMGVKTIITVDGAAPDVEMAERHGLRYVHLPHGYDGIGDERSQELAKAVSELEGPIYIHCHHGKHRSPAAACVASVGAGLISPEVVPEVLELAGTSKAYRGLFASAESARAIDRDKLEAMEVEFHEITPIPPLAEAMVGIEQTHYRLKQIAEAGWQTPADHPDLVPAHEALLLREHFTELLRTEEAKAEGPEFLRILQGSETDAKTLEEMLGEPVAENLKPLNRAFEGVSNDCKSCHEKFRDVPL